MMKKSCVLLVCISFTMLALGMIISASGIEEPTEPVFVEVADYYDNRKAVVTVTADDWYASTTQPFEDMSTMLVEKQIYYTGGVITALSPDWNQIQRWLNQGYLEAAAHSRTHKHLNEYDASDYDWEIGGSKDDIIGNLTLPPTFSSGSREYIYSWIEPYGESDSTVRQKLGYYKYLVDRSTSTNVINWATWNYDDGLYGRIGYTIRMGDDGTEDITILNSKFDGAYDAGGIYYLMCHPKHVNWSQGQYADSHTDHISNRNDVWYVNFGHLYLYRWTATQNVVQVTSTGSGQDKVFKINMSSTDRQNYGAKYPVTYVFDIPPSWTNPYMHYRFLETDPWTTMETKTSSDFFNGINAVRYDFQNHKAYVSIGFDDTSNDIHLQILPEAPNQPPVADANGPYTGTEGEPITFDGSGSYDPDGAIASYLWDFGDGETSAEQNPTHVYTQDSVYTITLTVTDDDSANDTDTTTATVADKDPMPDFNASPTSGTEPLQVNFEDASNSHDGIVGWTWDFGDGHSSTDQNPTHIYASDDTYTIVLTVVEDDGDSAMNTKEAYINVTDTKPSANFTESQTSTFLTVNFIDTSTSYDQIVSWFWDFGDGQTSTEQNSTHKFPDDGTFNVSLTVTDDDGSKDTITKQVSIVNVGPTADFNVVSSTKPTVDEDITFLDQSSDPDGVIVSWFWDFGDGQTSTEQNSTHKFPDDGTFNVSLTVTDDDGSKDTITKQVSIVNVGPTADFNVVSSTKPTVDEDITFLDQSSDPDGVIVSWFWDLGDGTNSPTQNVTHRYYALGTFIVNLTVTDDDGQTNTISKSVTIYDVVPPVTLDDYDGLRHTSNFTINLNATDDLSGVQTTYYIINGGPTMNVQTHAQPSISVEGNNKLEYWSVDNAGNEETHHVIQNIKLDKTSRPRAIWIVGGITLAIGTSAAGIILYLRSQKRKGKNQILRRSQETSAVSVHTNRQS